MTRKLLYVAGPYSSDPVVCTRVALMTATAIYERTEFVPVVPHLSHFWHLLTPLPYEDWLAIDFALLERCHAITRLPGDSPGADREVARALQLELPMIEFTAMAQAVQHAHACASAGLLVGQ